MSMKPLALIRDGMSENELAFIREMGVEYVELNTNVEQALPELLAAEKARLAAHDLKIAILSCMPLQKNDVIDLNLTEKDGRPVSRDEEIEKFRRMVRSAAANGIQVVSVAWQPTGIKRTGRSPRPHTRGGTATYVEMAEIAARPNDYDRVYTEEEAWDNFAYFLAGVSPVMKECGVRMALHPNDPPVPSLCGVGSLIWNMDGYRRAIALDRDGVVGVKMCIGCWLEGGERFGDVLSDIAELQADDRIVCVHFRNVSSPLPDFEETLCEDGYADMHAIMKQLITVGYEGTISIDHAFGGYPELGGMLGASAYPIGYMKGLIHAIEREMGKRNH